MQSKTGTNDFFRGTKFFMKNAPKFSTNFLSMKFVGLKNPAKFPPHFPAKMKNIHRRASAGAQGEHFCKEIPCNKSSKEIQTIKKRKDMD